MEFVLGSFKCGESLNLISAVDFANSADRTLASSCPQGIGTLLGKLAVSSRIQFYSPVTQIQWDASLVKVETRSGALTARAVIVTASTGVLGSGKIKFQPGLPARYIEAIGKLRLGSYDHVALEFDNNPLALKKDDLIFEKATGRRTAALLANVSGTGLHVVEIAGKLGADLALEGEAAMTAFAIDWVEATFGSKLKSRLKRTHATRWSITSVRSFAPACADPWRRRQLRPWRLAGSLDDRAIGRERHCRRINARSAGAGIERNDTPRSIASVRSFA